MFGNPNEPKGVLRHAIETIFAFIETSPEKEFLIRLSYFEIFNENIKDLLASDKKNLQFEENEIVYLFRY